MQCNLKTKVLITTALDLDEYLWACHYETTNEARDIIQIIHEETTEVKRTRLVTLTHEYELFIMKLKENINQMQTRFTHIVIHMRTLG